MEDQIIRVEFDSKPNHTHMEWNLETGYMHLKTRNIDKRWYHRVPKAGDIKFALLIELSQVMEMVRNFEVDRMMAERQKNAD